MKRKILFLLFAVMVSFILCSPTIAGNREGAWSITPFIGGYNFDSSENLDNALLYGLRLGYNFTDHWTVEAVGTFANDVDWDGKTYSQRYGWQKLDNETDMYGYKLEVLYNFLPDGMIVPFVAAGAGGRYLEWDKGGSDHDFIVDYGAGLKIFFADWIALRGDIRHVYLPQEEFNNVEYGVGLSFFFGGKKAEMPAPAPAPVPEPAPVVAPEPDTDGDGVIDKLDQCPDTPAGVKVDEVGCPLDSDKDGVYDYLDKCPDTPIELKVDKDGCPMKVTINLNVLFDFDKSDIKPKYHNEIKRVADYMNAYPWEKATLEGHTDSKGTDAYNQKLSQRRVDAVQKYLVEKFGISADRLKAVGYGESKPIATNDTDEGRQLNRRVQAVMETYIRK